MTPHHTLLLDGVLYETALSRKYALRRPHAPKVPGRVEAVIPGLVLELLVAPGDRVRRGQSLLILEAMKMQNHLAAPLDGVVERLAAAPGETVAKGQLLVVLEPADSGDEG